MNHKHKHLQQCSILLFALFVSFFWHNIALHTSIGFPESSVSSFGVVDEWCPTDLMLGFRTHKSRRQVRHFARYNYVFCRSYVWDMLCGYIQPKRMICTTKHTGYLIYWHHSAYSFVCCATWSVTIIFECIQLRICNKNNTKTKTLFVCCLLSQNLQYIIRCSSKCDVCSGRNRLMIVWCNALECLDDVLASQKDSSSALLFNWVGVGPVNGPIIRSLETIYLFQNPSLQSSINGVYLMPSET